MLTVQSQKGVETEAELKARKLAKKVEKSASRRKEANRRRRKKVLEV
jgi:hypothetical protein